MSSQGPVNVTLKTIDYLTDEGARPMTIVAGCGFYKSTGKNSGYEGVWFPFTGVAEKDILGKGRGWVSKPLVQSDSFPQEVVEKINEIIPYVIIKGREVKSEFVERFATFPSMLVSSQMGGGIWDTPQGKEVKNYLKQYLASQGNDFYNKFPVPSFVSTGLGFDENNIGKLNKWLKKEAGGETDVLETTADVFKNPRKSLFTKITDGVRDILPKWLLKQPSIVKPAVPKMNEAAFLQEAKAIREHQENYPAAPGLDRSPPREAPPLPPVGAKDLGAHGEAERRMLNEMYRAKPKVAGLEVFIQNSPKLPNEDSSKAEKIENIAKDKIKPGSGKL